MSDLDTSMPPWLQRNIAPQSPWITFGEMAQLNEQRQKLPLQIQGMALQNQAMQVQTEHQGLINETLSRDLQDQKEDVPLFNEWVDQYRNNPAAMVDSPEPPVKSLKYQNMVLQAKHMAAQTTYAKVYQQQQIADTTLATQLRNEGIDVTPAMIEGRFGRSGPVEWDSATLSQLQAQAIANKQAAAESLARTKQEHYYDENGNLIVRNSPLELATQIAGLRSDLRKSQQASRGLLPSDPAAQAEFEKQTNIQDKLNVLEAKTGARNKADVELVTYGGKQFLKNTVTGALHEVSKTVDRQQFIASHITAYLRDMPGGNADEAARQLGEIYDKHLAPQTAPGGLPPPAGTPKPSFRYDPATKKLIPK